MGKHLEIVILDLSKSANTRVLLCIIRCDIVHCRCEVENVDMLLTADGRFESGVGNVSVN